MMTKQLEISVDDEYYDLVPRPNKLQRKSLKESIRKEGLLEPIIVNKKGVILDGHSRYEICEELSLKPKYQVKQFKTKTKERQYVVTSNVRRRHLNDFQLLELLEKELEIIAEKAKQDWYKGDEIGNGHKKKDRNLKSDMKRRERSVYKELGDELGLNPIRIEKFMYVKRHGNPQQIQECRDTGQMNSIIKQLETLRGKQIRDMWIERKVIDEKSPFKICPACGTGTLKVYVGIKEKYCTQCNYHYTIQRRLD